MCDEGCQVCDKPVYECCLLLPPLGWYCRDCLLTIIAEHRELIGARVKLDISAHIHGSSGDEISWESLEKCVERITITANGETQVLEPPFGDNPSPQKG